MVRMKKSSFTETQIIAILRQAEGEVPISDLCRETGISTATSYGWCSKFGGMDASMVTALNTIMRRNATAERTMTPAGSWRTKRS